jgi:hypothetical protein
MRTDHIHALNDRLDAMLNEADEAIAIATHELDRLKRLRDHLGRARAETTAETGGAPIDLPQMLRRVDDTARAHRALMESEKADWMARATHAIEGDLAIGVEHPRTSPYPLPEVVDEVPDFAQPNTQARS